MPTRDQVIAEARTWIGTPWGHQGRLKGVGTDCGGVILGVGKALGVVPLDREISGYGRQPRPFLMRSYLMDLFDPIRKMDLMPGDILWLRAGEHAQHLAIYCGNGAGRETMIHAPVEDVVVETPIDAHWKLKIVAAFRYRGIDG